MSCDSIPLKISCLLAFLCLALNAGASSSLATPDPELREYLKQAIEASDSFQDRFEAEVWLVDMSRRLERFIANSQKRVNFLKRVHYEASRSELTPELVLAVIEVESRFDRFAISKAGARGLMQIMPFWLKEIGRPDNNLFQMETNLPMGCTILKYYLKKEKGNLTRALMRYNGSLGSHRYTTKVYKALDKNWRYW